MEQGFSKAGLTVTRNNPYKGGYITDHYGRMAEVEALQIEMCERVYMDENPPAAAPGDPRFGRAKALIRGVLETVCREAKQRLQH